MKSKLSTLFFTLFYILVFVGGYFLPSMLGLSLTTEDEFKMYEELARDIYEKGDEVIKSIPEGLKVELSNLEMTISSANKCGLIKAHIGMNNELIVSRYSESLSFISVSMIFGIILTFIVCGLVKLIKLTIEYT